MKSCAHRSGPGSGCVQIRSSSGFTAHIASTTARSTFDTVAYGDVSCSSPKEVRYKNADMAARVSVWGSVAECVDKLGQLVRAGAKHLLLNPVFDEMDQMEVLAADIVPRL